MSTVKNRTRKAQRHKTHVHWMAKRLLQVSSVTVQNRLCVNVHGCICSGPEFPPETRESLRSVGKGRKHTLLVPKAWSPKEPISLYSFSPLDDQGGVQGGHRKGGGDGFSESSGSQTTTITAPPGGHVKTQSAGPQPQSFCFSESRAGPDNLHF